MVKKQTTEQAADNKAKDMSLGKKGYTDVLAFLVKSLGAAVMLFAAFYLIMQDLKVSEQKKVLGALLQTAQENIRQLEANGVAMNRYIISRKGKLDRNAASFVWNIAGPTNMAKAMMWYSPADKAWRIMEEGSKHRITKHESDARTTEIEQHLKSKSNFTQSKAVIEPQRLEALLSTTGLDVTATNINFVPWMFSLKSKGENPKIAYLLLLPDIDKLFSLEQTEQQTVAIHSLTLFKPYDRKPLFTKTPTAMGNTMFAPMHLRDSLFLSGEAWEAEIIVAPTTAYILFTILPWFVLGIGVSFSLIGGLYLHRSYTRENQLAHISESLANKKTELQSKESERLRMVNEFRKSEWESRAIINAVSDIIFETDSSGTLLFLNDTWRKITGRDVSSMIGENLFDQLHPDDVSQHKEMFKEFTAGYREAYRREARLRVVDKRYRFIELGFSMIRLSDDTARVVGTMTDIEKRKKAEIAHYSAEKQYKAMFENALNGIYQVAPEGDFISLNQAFADILGYDSPDELRETVRNMRDQLYVDPHQRSLLEVQATSQGKVIGAENEIRKKDGSHIWVLENLRAIYDNEGQVQYYEGNVWDITERRLADQALRTAKLEAELTSRARIEFMANMSHELRTPLNAVIGFSEIIQNEVMGPIGEEVYVEYARDINQSGNQLLKIINDILELSQIEIGDRELKEKAFPLMRVVQSVFSLMDHKLKEGKLQVSVDVPKELPNIFAEELAMKQILINILSNSVKYTPEGGKIDVRAYVDGENQMVVEVEDTGIGMSVEELEKALQPFGQAAAELDRDNSGTGLGLSIIQALVELHNGRFLMTSQKDVGTQIKIVFPQERVMPLPDKRPDDYDDDFAHEGGDDDMPPPSDGPETHTDMVADMAAETADEADSGETIETIH